MRFKMRQTDSQKHTEICTDVAWNGNDVYSVGDDKVILKWDSDTRQNQKFMDLDQYPTSIDCTKSAQNDILAVGFTDGGFWLIPTKGSNPTKVSGQQAHKNSALISLRWSHDGQSLCTSGEDGQIKIWSRKGDVRTTLVKIDKPIYKVLFSPNNDQVLFCTDRQISIKSQQAGQKLIQWKAHDGVVLAVDWNASNNMILSCGEDCRYKIWDHFGRLLFSSSPYEYVITSIAWAPNGEYFSVGAYGMFKLCDKTGWTYSFDKTEHGSLMNVKWSADSTICSGAAANGSVAFGYIVDRSYSYGYYDVTLNEDNKMSVTNLKIEDVSDIDFKDRIINISLGSENMILNTPRQCYIYNFQNINTPHIFEIKDAISVILQSPKYFALVEVSSGILIYNYEGRLSSNPKIQGIKFESLNKKRISISQDILAIVDVQQPKVVKFYDMSSGQQMNFTLEHSLEIVEIHLNQIDPINERKIAFVDSNKDLYISPVHKRDITKMTAMTDSFLWNDRFDILSCIADSRLITWFYPNAIYVDKDIMEQTKIVKEANEIGRMCQMLTFCGSQVTLRKKNGAIVMLAVSPYPQMLFEFCEKQKWKRALKLCRYIGEQYLWACLASCSLHNQMLDVAEISLASIESVDKVQYVNYIKDLPGQVSKQAALSLYFHKKQEAEQTLIQSKLYYRAIKLNIKLYKWDKAYEIAKQYNVHQDTFIAYRKRYLERIGKEENNKTFAALAKEVGEIDWTAIKQKIRDEKDMEQKRDN